MSLRNRIENGGTQHQGRVSINFLPDTKRVSIRQPNRNDPFPAGTLPPKQKKRTVIRWTLIFNSAPQRPHRFGQQQNRPFCYSEPFLLHFTVFSFYCQRCDGSLASWLGWLVKWIKTPHHHTHGTMWCERSKRVRWSPGDTWAARYKIWYRRKYGFRC